MAFSGVTPDVVVALKEVTDLRKLVGYQADGLRHTIEYKATKTARTYSVHGPSDATIFTNHCLIGSAGVIVNSPPWSLDISNARSEIVTAFKITYSDNGTATGESNTVQLSEWTRGKRFKPVPIPKESV